MKEILLCALNSKFIHSSLAAHSIKAAYDYYTKTLPNSEQDSLPKLSVCEFTINDSHQSVLYHITSKQPDAVCFSVYLWNVRFISALCRDIKACFPDCTIVLGGPEVSFGVDNAFFSEDMYDYVIEGEGEKSFFALFSKLNNTSLAASAEDFRINQNGKVIKAQTAAVLDSLPFVYNKENINLFKIRISFIHIINTDKSSTLTYNKILLTVKLVQNLSCIKH